RSVHGSIALVGERELRNGVEVDVDRTGLRYTARVAGVEREGVAIPEATIQPERSPPRPGSLEVRIEHSHVPPLIRENRNPSVARRWNGGRVRQVGRPIRRRRSGANASEQGLPVAEPVGVERAREQLRWSGTTKFSHSSAQRER